MKRSTTGLKVRFFNVKITNEPWSRGYADRQLLQRISVVTVVAELGTDLLRYRMPEHMRPFRVLFAVSRLPAVPVLAIASIALLLILFEWQPVALHYAEAH